MLEFFNKLTVTKDDKKMLMKLTHGGDGEVLWHQEATFQIYEDSMWKFFSRQQYLHFGCNERNYRSQREPFKEEEKNLLLLLSKFNGAWVETQV